MVDGKSFVAAQPDLAPLQPHLGSGGRHNQKGRAGFFCRQRIRMPRR